MATRIQKIKLVEDLRNYFLQKGKIPTSEEYFSSEDKPHTIWGIKNVAGNYSKALRMVKHKYPDIETSVEEKRRAEAFKALKIPTPPVVEVKPAEVSAVTQDEDDE